MSFCYRLDNVKILYLLIALLLAPITSMAESPDVVEVKLDTETDPEKKNRFQAYPNWPANRQADRELIPPPPPGPYMSLGRNDIFGNKSSFFQASVASADKSKSSVVPMQAYSPDTHWPENLSKSKRRVPENGYRYVPLQPLPTMKSYQQAQYDSLPNYNQGYRRYVTMSAPDPRWTPSAAYGAPYSYVPPVRTGQRTAVNRAPYPVAGQP